MGKKTAIIIGAGPAGLTAAYELLKNTDIKPIIFEKSNDIGGLSRTVLFKGNRIDIGGHRFFSKSDRIMSWWKNILPLENGVSPKKTDKVMLVRNRVSRIFFSRKFFEYPVSLRSLTNLNLFRTIMIILSYIKYKIFPLKPEKSLEEFFINRFGYFLYDIFFRAYTEKVWGLPCGQIDSKWGLQRIKGLSITSASKQMFSNLFSKHKHLSQKSTETSLIKKFMYPKLGAGQLWEEVAKYIESKGGKIYRNNTLIGLLYDNKITSAQILDAKSGKKKTIQGDYFFSSIPIKELIPAMGSSVPDEIVKMAETLVYRDYITVGLLVRSLKIKNKEHPKKIIPDNWIYIQEKDVKMGRIQIYNNWSPYIVKDPTKIFLGLEYFCDEGDELWSLSEKEISDLAIKELIKIGFIDKSSVISSKVIKVRKAYPTYFGSYSKFDVIRNFTDSFENLFLIGRNGMHRYNNLDHSMMTAIVSVENIMDGIKTKDNIWTVNTEEEYHEEKK